MKTRWIITGCLVGFAVIIILPPLIHGYVYPNQGDDTAYHLAYIDSLRGGVDSIGELYPARAIIGYPVMWLSNLTGWTIDVIFLWFNYLVLVMVGYSIFALVTYISDWRAGLLSIPLVVFTSSAILFQFNAGTIFSVITIGILFPLCLMLLIYVLEKRKKLMVAGAGIIIVLALDLHSLSIFSTPGYIEPIPSVLTFIVRILGVVVVICLLSVWVALVKLKVRFEPKHKIFLIISTLIIILMVVATFSGISAYSSRLSWYLAVVIAITTAVLIGIVSINKRMPIFTYVMVVLVMASALPQVVAYFDNNTVIKNVDTKAIEYVNALPGNHYSVSPEVAYWIYDRFIDGKTYRYGTYPYIERNEMMTFKTNPVVPYYWYQEEPFYPEGNRKKFRQGGYRNKCLLSLGGKLMEATEAVRGLTGKWHATDGSWKIGFSKLNTLCRNAISPNYRGNDTRPVNCLRCRVLLKKQRRKIKA